MAVARYSIGIDLGTTNSALAFASLVGDASPEVLLVAQWESLSALAETPTLPSFLYLPEEAVAARLRGHASSDGQWIVGRLARARMGETPGRVVHSAKSWLCHHTADRSAAFLPWGSTDLARDQKISPVRASALILSYLRGSWDSRHAAAGDRFDDQDITISVPASFDAAAQRLTIAAAEEAGFPDGVRLLEEPQAAFYSWLASPGAAPVIAQLAIEGNSGPRHILVVDIGGGTSDFTLFEVRRNERDPIPDITRVAVSDHILLGGDNVDLALAHLAESGLPGGRGQLSGGQWDRLVSACRDLKEMVLSREGPPEERFTVALPGRGASMVGGAQTTALTRAEIERLLLDGFYPSCNATARPHRMQGALQEWGLPYASDSAVTRHLADFLRDRPRVNEILFNGGSVLPALVRQRIREQIGHWQDGYLPFVLENAEPALAVARGAARYGALLYRGARHIEASVAHAVFLEVQPKAAAQEAAGPTLLCILPYGASPEEQYEVADPPLELLTDRPVRFQAFSSARHTRNHAGDVVALQDGDFHALPPLQTIIRTDQLSATRASRTIPVRLVARMNALGLLQISAVSADPALGQSWPLEFDLRTQTLGSASREAVATIEPNATREAIDAAHIRIGNVFGRSGGKTAKASTGPLFRSLEQILGSPRSAWNGPLLRALWPALDQRLDGRGLSVDHEEIWLVVAGFMLRPGFGVAGDDLRMDALWRLHEAGPCFPGRRIETQAYILWRRVAGGLTQDRQIALLAGEIGRIRDGRAPPELVRLAGSLELIPLETKFELVQLFIDAAAALASEGGHCAPYIAALGLLLNRAPLHAGPETVLSPDFVERAYDALRPFDWARPDLLEVQTLFLRAARVIGDRRLDVAKPLRNQIANKLEKSGMPPLRTAKIRDFIALSRLERVGMYDESLPPGLVFGMTGNGITV